MRKIIFTLFLFVLFQIGCNAQKIDRDFLIGKWKLCTSFDKKELRENCDNENLDFRYQFKRDMTWTLGWGFIVNGVEQSPINGTWELKGKTLIYVEKSPQKNINKSKIKKIKYLDDNSFLSVGREGRMWIFSPKVYSFYYRVD